MSQTKKVTYFISIGNSCTQCDKGYFKGKEGADCQLCPPHTHSSEDRMKCVLYDCYIINDQYAFFMRSFDSLQEKSDKTPTDYYDKGFFGPFSSSI